MEDDKIIEEEHKRWRELLGKISDHSEISKEFNIFNKKKRNT